MSAPQYLFPGFDFALAHAIEEAGEFLAAAGKTQRFGRTSVNPELPPEQQETNLAWLTREATDLRLALDRLHDEVATGRDVTLAEKVGELLVADTICSGRVTGDTVRAIVDLLVHPAGPAR